MIGDFSRFTFDRHNEYSAVYMQQGRVLLDADWNEQVDILRHHQQTPLSDLFGTMAFPGAAGTGFQFTLPDVKCHNPQTFPDFEMHAPFDHFYVKGMLCENLHVRDTKYSAYCAQWTPHPKQNIPADKSHVLVYLDMWERNVSSVDAPALREIALDGPDTATRRKVEWRIRLHPYSGTAIPGAHSDIIASEVTKELDAFASNANLLIDEHENALIHQNRLYRIEIHSVSTTGVPGKVMVKWSRNNGGTAFAVANINPRDTGREWRLTLRDANAEQLTAIAQRGMFEVSNRQSLHTGKAYPLVPVSTDTVTVSGANELIIRLPPDTIWPQDATDCVLRHWDGSFELDYAHADTSATAPPKDSLPKDFPSKALRTEGFTIAFDNFKLRAGDYWLLPMRAGAGNGNGGIWLPQYAAGDGFRPIPPSGTTHHHVPLALFTWQGDGWSEVWSAHRDPTSFFTIPQLVQKVGELEGRCSGLQDEINVLQDEVDSLKLKVANLSKIRTEWVWTLQPSAYSLEEGEVVAIDPEQPSHIKLAERGEERLIVGVIGKKEVHNKQVFYQVVSHGRLSCKIAGSVDQGDPLVISERPGYACRAGFYIRPGTLIGKALATHAGEGLAGEGTAGNEAEILVSLG